VLLCVRHRPSRIGVRDRFAIWSFWFSVTASKALLIDAL
jgi:hypothetical protein